MLKPERILDAIEEYRKLLDEASKLEAEANKLLTEKLGCEKGEAMYWTLSCLIETGCQPERKGYSDEEWNTIQEAYNKMKRAKELRRKAKDLLGALPFEMISVESIARIVYKCLKQAMS